jgi:hypothetical protein
MLLPSTTNSKLTIRGAFGTQDGFTSGYTVSLIKPWTPGTELTPVLFTVTDADYNFTFRKIPPGTYSIAAKEIHEYSASTAYSWFILPKLVTVTRSSIKVTPLIMTTSVVTVAPKFTTGSIVRIKTPVTAPGGGLTGKDPIAWDTSDSTYYPPKILVVSGSTSGTLAKVWLKMGDYPEIRGTSSWSAYRSSGYKVIDHFVIEDPGSLYDTSTTDVIVWGKRVDIDATGNVTTTVMEGSSILSLAPITFANSDTEANVIINSDRLTGAAQTPLIMTSGGATLARDEYLPPYTVDPSSSVSAGSKIDFLQLYPGVYGCHGLSIPSGFPTFVYNKAIGGDPTYAYYAAYPHMIPSATAPGGSYAPYGTTNYCPGDNPNANSSLTALRLTTGCATTATAELKNRMQDFLGLNFDWGGASRTGFVYNKMIYSSGFGDSPSVQEALRNGEFGDPESLTARYQVDIIKGYIGREFMIGSTLDSNGTETGKTFQDQLQEYMDGVLNGTPCSNPVVDFLNFYLTAQTWSRTVALSLLANFSYQFQQAIWRAGFAFGQNLYPSGSSAQNPFAAPKAYYDAFWREMRNFGRQALGSLESNPPAWLVGKSYSSTIVGGPDNGKTVQITFNSTGYTRTVTP